MKKIFIGILVFILAFSFVGCGAKERLEEKIAKKVFDTAGDGDLDIDGDKVTIKGDKGEQLTFGDSKWPTSELAKNIPEFKDGTVNGVMETTDSVVITVESVQEEDAFSYFETIKKDFPKDVFEMNAEDSVTFHGNNDAGINVALVYISGVLTITVTAPRQ